MTGTGAGPLSHIAVTPWSQVLPRCHPCHTRHTWIGEPTLENVKSRTNSLEEGRRMAYLAPSDLTAAALSGGRTAELRTLEVLRSALPNDYTVFHSVHWSREWRSVVLSLKAYR